MATVPQELPPNAAGIVSILIILTIYQFLIEKCNTKLLKLRILIIISLLIELVVAICQFLSFYIS